MSKENTTPTVTEKQAGQLRPRTLPGPFAEMERMFELFNRGGLLPSRWEWPSWAEMPAVYSGPGPKVDIIDREDEILLRAELPGVDKKDIDISVNEDSVTLKGSTKLEHKEEKGDYVRSEIAQGSFSRTLTLPASVDPDKAKASFKDGILELTLPKQARSKRKTIKVE
ncbi:Hsp20/alpha crystallin family protein [Thiohalobacter sp. IOR34]|uniref:Hsp20/alpha crystallin family protein n=1 Tax=Thiohalobacter sp. IOR34 TaxID=3057176 RepID=UPI0025AF84F2|nr:Hsp20/alpha crystallin family protein [Thiohalobacter sp. IOR34]WJW76630.1 Hsp20/alpha crystallin family protein [Thiohalobacter sp. IOR34]